MILLRNIGRLFTAGERGTIEQAAVAIDGERIAWAGPSAEAPRVPYDEVDCGGRLVTPGLIDAHTHPLYAGSRCAEIGARSAGASYLEIAQAGGGIGATVRATRDASFEALGQAASDRLASWLAGGTTTVEAKTGYHLDRSGEIEAVRTLAGLDIPRVEVTFLAAHAVPPEYIGDQGAYVDEVISWCPEAAAAGARHCDVFCDEGYFTVEESRRLLLAARLAGLLPRLHADELARTGGAQLAAEIGASSADHLLRITAEDARALADAGVVATLAPVTALSIGTLPPVAALQAAGATVALATDHNPGTCGTTSMSLVVALAVTGLGMSVDAALSAATLGGAASLRLGDRGRVEPGLLADLVVWDADHEGAFAWSFGLTPAQVWLGGRVRE